MPIFKDPMRSGSPEEVERAIGTGVAPDPDALLREAPKAEVRRALETGEVWDPEMDNAALTEAEAARRTKFWNQCVKVNLDLAEMHRVAIQEAMARRKTGAWASFNGEDVVLDKLRVEGNVIIVTFEFFGGYQYVDERIQL